MFSEICATSEGFYIGIHKSSGSVCNLNSDVDQPPESEHIQLKKILIVKQFVVLGCIQGGGSS